MFIEIPDRTVKHVLKRHRDWVEMLKLATEDDVKRFLQQVVEYPDEIYSDRFRAYVKYYLKKLDKYFLCVVVVRDTVATAYLINSEKYRARRWIR